MKQESAFTFDIPDSCGFSVKMTDVLNRLPGGLSIYRMYQDKVRPVFRNPTYYQVMGYSEKHIAAIRKGETFIGVHPEDLLPLQEKTAELLRDGGELSHIFRVFHDQSGHYRWFRLAGSRQCLEDGSVLFYAVYTDVTGEKLLEAELRDANGKKRFCRGYTGSTGCRYECARGKTDRC